MKVKFVAFCDKFESYGVSYRILRERRNSQGKVHLILKEIDLEYSLERLLLKLKLQYLVT